MLCRRVLLNGTAGLGRSYTFGRYETPPKIVQADHCDRETSSKEYHFNRNPRNSELLGFKPRSLGYTEDEDRIPTNYYHRIEVKKTGKHIHARLVHFENGEILSVSTTEPWIRARLYRTYDRCAALNLGRVLAHRMKTIGLNSAMFWDPTNSEYSSEKTEAFLSGLQMEGVSLGEDETDAVLYWDAIDGGDTAYHHYHTSGDLLAYMRRKAKERKELLDE